jgi:hypothetical protein
MWWPVLVANHLHDRESVHGVTPMLGISWETRSPLKDLVPIESVTSPSQDKGKGQEQTEVDEGKPKKAQSFSLTISEYEGAFNCGDALGTNPPVLSQYMLSTWWFHVHNTNIFLGQNMLSSFRIH